MKLINKILVIILSIFICMNTYNAAQCFGKSAMGCLLMSATCKWNPIFRKCVFKNKRKK